MTQKLVKIQITQVFESDIVFPLKSKQNSKNITEVCCLKIVKLTTSLKMLLKASISHHLLFLLNQFFVTLQSHIHNYIHSLF